MGETVEARVTMVDGGMSWGKVILLLMMLGTITSAIDRLTTEIGRVISVLEILASKQ